MLCLLQFLPLLHLIFLNPLVPHDRNGLSCSHLQTTMQPGGLYADAYRNITDCLITAKEGTLARHAADRPIVCM